MNMPSSFGKQRPRLADVQCTRMQFQPGDRLLVKVFQPKTPSEMKKIRKMVERWAGSHVEVLVVDVTQMEIRIEQSRTELQKSV